MTDERTYGTKVKQFREERGWPQEQLAAVAGLSPRTIQRIEARKPASFESLKAVATAFGVDVKDLSKESNSPDVNFLIRLHNGANLFKIVGNADAFDYDHEVVDDGTVHAVASFLQDIHDYAESWEDIGPGDRVRATHEFTERIRDLEELGLWVFGFREPRPVTWNGMSAVLTVATLYIVQGTNPTIIKIDLNEHAVQGASSASMDWSTQNTNEGL